MKVAPRRAPGIVPVVRRSYRLRADECLEKTRYGQRGEVGEIERNEGVPEACQ